MNFKNYLKEQNLSTIEDINEFIQKNCQPFLKEAKGKELYRGMSRIKGIADIKRPRKNRKPLTMDPNIHEILDEIFQKLFGWKARSESIFTTPEKDEAASYGHQVYAIYPIGPFKYVWSKDLDDSIELQREIESALISLYGMKKGIERMFKIKKSINKPTKEEYEMILNVVKKFNFQTNNLHKVKFEEVMIKCESYLAVKDKEYEF